MFLQCLIIHIQFSQVFGSIDSEQSVPRTAPIATPEHDSSLVDLMHDASNNNRTRHNHQSMEAQQSLDGLTNDIFNDDPSATLVSDSAAEAANVPSKTSPGISDRRRLFLSGNSKRSPHHEDKSMDTTDNNSSRMVPTVFNFNLDSPTTMEAEDGHIISSGGETSNPIPIPGSSNYLLAPAAFDSDGLTPSPMSISDQHFSDNQGRAFQPGWDCWICRAGSFHA